MPIPKVIYQTWETKELHPNCIIARDQIQKLNPEYEIILYDSMERDQFIRYNFDEYTYKCFSQLNIGASKADFWRYCILYINGGVYLDLDADITCSLDTLIREDDQCIITRESHKGIFNQWILIFDKGHPIMKKAIENCCYNISNRTTNDIFYLTGPQLFTKSVNEILSILYDKPVDNLYDEPDESLNVVLNNPDKTVRGRFCGIDMNDVAAYHHAYYQYLYINTTYWKHENKPIYKE
jgi:mannosyltransferase OCH1-like enzyme